MNSGFSSFNWIAVAIMASNNSSKKTHIQTHEIAHSLNSFDCCGLVFQIEFASALKIKIIFSFSCFIHEKHKITHNTRLTFEHLIFFSIFNIYDKLNAMFRWLNLSSNKHWNSVFKWNVSNICWHMFQL